MTDIDLRKTLAEIDNLNQETRKMIEEARKIKVERITYPMVAASGFTAAIIALTKLIL